MERSDPALHPVRLMSMRYGAADIVLYEFEALDGRDLPRAEAGAHLDVCMPGGIVRQYSLLTPLCDARRYVVAVKREEAGRGGSTWLHDSARVGVALQVSAPRNHFALTVSDAPVLLLAGGIGITPVYAMLEALRVQGRAVHLHYWCRSPEHALFHQFLEQSGDATLHYSSRSDRPQTSLAAVLEHLPGDTEVYCCGPQRMLDELDGLAGHLGPRLHVERFQATEAPGTADQAFTIVLAKSGREVAVAAGENILQVLLKAGEDVMYSCEQGICGACEVKVIDGQPVHCDSVRTADEHTRQRTMMICCSSSASARLVLDI